MGSVTWCSPAQLKLRYGRIPLPSPPRVDPRVLAAARAVMAAGWRVTSIYRPDGGHHSMGIALDIAPLLYATHSFGPRTAKHVLFELSRVGIAGPWLVVSERDHVHVQLHQFDAFGWQPKFGELYLTRLESPQ